MDTICHEVGKLDGTLVAVMLLSSSWESSHSLDIATDSVTEDNDDWKVVTLVMEESSLRILLLVVI
jgi:hypothetical protein